MKKCEASRDVLPRASLKALFLPFPELSAPAGKPAGGRATFALHNVDAVHESVYVSTDWPVDYLTQAQAAIRDEADLRPLIPPAPGWIVTHINKFDPKKEV